MVLGGFFGLHRFYVGRWKSGLLYACTLACAGFGLLYDLTCFNDVLCETNEGWITSLPTTPENAPCRVYP